MVPRSAVVLVGGPAAYSGHSLSQRPRILLPVGNHPLLTYLSSNLYAAGVRRLIVCHSPHTDEYRETIKTALSAIPFSFEVITRETMLGTGGSIKQVEDLLEGESFWVMGGDAFMRADLDQMLAFHRAEGRVATLAAIRLRNAPWQMERVESGPQMVVKAVHRMHPCEEKRSMLRPVSLYIFEPPVFDIIPQNSYYDLKEQLFTTLYSEGKPASVWEVPEHARTLVSVDEYFAANQDFLLNRMKFPEIKGTPSASPRPSASLLGPVSVRAGTRLGQNTLVVGPAVMEESETDANSVIVESLVMRNVRIGAGVYMNHCLIGEGAVIDDGVVLHDAIIPMNSRISAEMAESLPIEQEVRASAPFLKWLDAATSPGSLYRFTKRAIDVSFAAVALLLLSPLMALIALAIKLDSPGSAFFAQTRCTRSGRKFSMIKFRTMFSNAEELKREITDLNEVDGPTFKLTFDPRVTRVGKLLRDTNLDEIPQLINVLSGDMSLIGPRPLAMDEMCYNPIWRDARLSVAPGLTGLWQVEAHSKAQFSEWIRHDLAYAKNASSLFDAKIFFRTLNKFMADFFDFLWKPRRKRRL
jgi:lipopolysaccharide/colanic/teichoic acid biosynthesis glycosyltransferase/NDP-sugar pyrophosphorylase family protein